MRKGESSDADIGHRHFEALPDGLAVSEPIPVKSPVLDYRPIAPEPSAFDVLISSFFMLTGVAALGIAMVAGMIGVIMPVVGMIDAWPPNFGQIREVVLLDAIAWLCVYIFVQTARLCRASYNKRLGRDVMKGRG